MARNRFVTPGVVRLPLSEGDWINVKRELNVGEERRLLALQIKSMNLGERARLDPEMVGKAQVLVYLLGWSLTNGTGEPVPYPPMDANGLPVDEEHIAERSAVLNGLDGESFGEIQKALDAHIEAMEAQRSAAKKSQDGGSTSTSTSPSVN